MKTIPKRRNIVTPYNALLADIQLFVNQLERSNSPKIATRGTLPSDKLEWLGECVKTADCLGYKVEVRMKDALTLEFFLIEKLKQPVPNWNWR